MIYALIVALTFSGLSLNSRDDPTRATAAEKVAQFTLWSIIATDRQQTKHWIRGTRENPTGDCRCLWEANPLIAGRPDVLDEYFDWWSQAVRLTPARIDANLSSKAMFLASIPWLALVVQNNKVAREHGLPQYGVLEYRWSF